MAESAPKISVVVPCHNAAAYLKAALDSLLAQRPIPWEIIFIDDGSTDGSGAIAASYGPPVLCYSQENQGIASARNRGLRVAKGDLIAFLDADDLWPANSLGLRLAKLIEAPGLDGAYGLVEAFASPDLPEEERLSLHVPPGTQAGRLAGCLLLRREVFGRVGKFDDNFTVGETMDWIARAEEQGIALGMVDEVVLLRRIHGASTTAKTQRLQADYLRLLRASLARRRAGPGDAPAESAP
jgi:glycosyltransferase involved in cell wall biosynthesis